jgi:anti-anti-sigma factor
MDFHIRIRHHAAGATLTCVGELDSLASSRLDEAVALCLEREPQALHLDATSLSLLTSAGVGCFVSAARECHARGIEFSLATSKQGRRILDLVGLWWLGVVDDGMALETAMIESQKRYAELRFEEQINPRKLEA